jgi:NADH-quinone oxidoreductase subunit E
METIACFGSCALAPVMVIDETVYGKMTLIR